MECVINNIFSLGDKKLLCFPDKIKAYFSGEAVVPITLEIQPTEICNHKCPQCQSHFILGAKEASGRALTGKELDLEIIDVIADAPPLGIIISGHTGEPLMHSRIDVLLERIYDLNIPVVFISNGELINKDIAALLVKVCRGIRISLDAYDAHSYKKTHGVSEKSWLRVIDGVRHLIIARNNIGKDSKLCSIGVGFLTNEKTEPGMADATTLAKSLGVDYIQFRPFHFQEYNIDKTLRICQTFEEPNFFNVYSSYQKYSRFGSFSRKYSMCHGSFFYTVLDPRGDLYICCHHTGDNEAKIGSLYEKTWRDLLDRDLKSSVATKFPNKSCVSFCRLHTHNELLHSLMQSAISINPHPADKTIANHDVFL